MVLSYPVATMVVLATYPIAITVCPHEPQRNDSLLVGGRPMGTAPPPKPSPSPFFPAGPSSPGSSRPLRSKTLVCSGAPLHFAPEGFGGVSLPMTVSPSQRIGLCGIKGDRP